MLFQDGIFSLGKHQFDIQRNGTTGKIEASKSIVEDYLLFKDDSSK